MRPYRHIPFIATAIAALVCPLARAEELPASGPLPLGDVVAYARAHNPELEAAHQRQAAARAVPAQAAAWDDPTLAAESWNSPRAVPYDGADNNILKLSQRLPFPGKLGLKGRMAERDADMAAADARMTELTVLEGVKQAYWDLWLTDRHLAVYTRDLELARELAAGAAGRYAVGTGRQPDVLRAEVERTHIATRLVTTRLERERAAARLNELLSRGPEEALGTPVDPGPAHVPGPLDRTHLPQAEQSFAASRDAYAAGDLDFTSLVDSLRTIESTHLEHHEAAAAFEKAYASLETAVGGELPREERR